MSQFIVARLTMCVVVCMVLFSLTPPAHAQAQPTPVCPSQTIQPQPPDFQPDGIILTTFDREAIWVYNISGGNRYPLPETVPCTRNCRTSPDGLWLSRMESESGFAFYKMRFDGTQRTLMANSATDVEWWDPQTLLVWTPDLKAYLVPEADPTAAREYLDVRGVVNVQPGGRYALSVGQDEGGNFVRRLENLEVRGLTGVAGTAPINLGADIPYYNSAAWSPDGTWLAYVGQGVFDEATNVYGSELYGIRAGDAAPTPWTNFHGAYGAVRINGHMPGDLVWSPDGTKVACWVIELIGINPLADTGNAVVHVYDVTTGALNAYCGYSTIEHTPNPARLVWSPDGSHVAFGGNVPGDNEGYLLLALNVADGTITELSSGIFPALGAPDVIGWGRLP
ncbi:MAG: hypothetical protein AAFR22_00125 [Chloroflexota bacterium]